MWDEKHCENFLDALCMFPEQHLIKLERSRAFNPRTNVLTLVELWFPRFGIYYCHYINYFAKAVFCTELHNTCGTIKNRWQNHLIGWLSDSWRSLQHAHWFDCSRPSTAPSLLAVVLHLCHIDHSQWDKELKPELTRSLTDQLCEAILTTSHQHSVTVYTLKYNHV